MKRQDPRLQQLAAEAAHKIKVITEERDAQIKAIYQDYQEKVAAIRAESSTDSFVQTLVLLSEPHPQSIKHS